MVLCWYLCHGKSGGVELVYGNWGTIFEPKGLSAGQVAYWEHALRKVADTPEWKADLEKNFWTDDFLTGARLKKHIENKYAFSRMILLDIGLAK